MKEDFEALRAGIIVCTIIVLTFTFVCTLGVLAEIRELKQSIEQSKLK